MSARWYRDRVTPRKRKCLVRDEAGTLTVRSYGRDLERERADWDRMVSGILRLRRTPRTQRLSNGGKEETHNA